MTINDLRYLDMKSREQFILNTYESSLNRKFNLNEWPLHRFEVMQTDEDEFQIILSTIHLISDGLGNQKMIKELMEIYDSIINGHTTKQSPSLTASEYNQIIAQINEWTDPSELEALRNYLKQQGREKYIFNPTQSPHLHKKLRRKCRGIYSKTMGK